VDRFEKVKEELNKAADEDPNTIFVEMDFPIADALTKYLKSVEEFHESSKNEPLEL
jgi:hypothetical protein